MDLLIAWALAPALLAALALGWGTLAERACGSSLPWALRGALGLAAIVVVGGFLTLADATAELTTPAIAAGGAIGLAALAVGLPAAPSRWGAAAVAGVLAVYAAPIVASGEATFAGYIRLDDTATWMALTDRVMEHGRSLDGLEPSTYERTLAFNLGDGYPVGVFLPLGVLAALTGLDVAWLVQPYMACLAGLLAASLWALARSVLASAPAAAAVTFVAAQPALLYGYYLWGGIKEVAAAALVAALAMAVGSAARARFGVRALLAPALVCAALVGVLSGGGLLWAAPAVGVAAVLAARALGARAAALRGVVCAAAVAVLSIPVLAAGGALPPTSSPLSDPQARGNLVAPLEPAQLAGIWPAGDFRVDPEPELAGAIGIALVLCAAGGGIALAWRRRALPVLVYLLGALASAAAIWAVGSPWVDGKALAIAAPALPFAAMLAAALLPRGRARLAGVALGALVAAGVLWSNALAYREVNLAPREQLAELESLGELLGGTGPVLITDYQPYGARHFLRDAAPESVSELRHRLTPLRSGESVPKGESADTDALDPAGLFEYRALVLRRSPAQSRPPAAYRLAWRGDRYEAWRRAPRAAVPAARLPLGGEIEPTAKPRCGAVRRLAARAGTHGSLVAARRPPALAIRLEPGMYPQSWRVAGDPAHPRPEGAGELEARFELPRPERLTVWLGGSVRPRVKLAVNGKGVGEVRHELDHEGGYVRLGEERLKAGRHRLAVSFAGAGLDPGAAGLAERVGPLVLSRGEAGRATLIRVSAAHPERLCGHRWDWIEAHR